MRLVAIFFLVLALFAPLLAANNTTDDALYDKVRIELAKDREIGGANIQVTVRDGVVQLAGVVRTDKQKAKAAKIAKKVKGVRTVVNDLRIEPSS
jgi:osmotically-inducible protein OsmY